MMDSQFIDPGRVNRSTISLSAEIFEPSSMSNVKLRASMIQWMNSVLPGLRFPVNASDEELRVLLVDGSVLCQLLNKLKPGSVMEYASSDESALNIEKFLSAMDETRLPRFQKVDLEKGSMKIVLDCLLTLKTHFMSITMKEHLSRQPFTAPAYRAGHKHQEVFQPKQASYSSTPASNISETTTSSNFHSASTQSLLTVVNGILENSVECKTGEIPHRMSTLLRQVVQEIEKRIYTQNEHLKLQSNTFRAREEKYKSRIKMLEALGEETKNKIIMQPEPTKIDEKNKVLEQDLVRLVKEKDEKSQAITAQEKKLEVARKTNKEPIEDKHSQEIAALKRELEVARKANGKNLKDEHSHEIAALKQELEVARKMNEKSSKDEHIQEIAALKQELEVARKMNEKNSKDEHNQEIAALKQELEVSRKTNKKNSKDEHSQEIAALKQELEVARKTNKKNSKDEHSQEIAALKQELEVAREANEKNSKDEHSQEIAALKQELEVARKSNAKNSKDEHNKEIAALKQELEVARKTNAKNSKDEHNKEIAALRQELEVARKTHEKNTKGEHNKEIAALKQELEKTRQTIEKNMKDEHNKEIAALKQELEVASKSEKNTKDEYNHQISALKKELQVAKETYEQQFRQVEKEASEVQHKLEESLKEVSGQLTESRSKVKELEASSTLMHEQWNKKQNIYHIFTDFQLGALRELRFSSQSIRQEVMKTEKNYSQEFNQLGKQIRDLQDAAQNYYTLLGENRKLHNELQELKGNIRVYCRIRPHRAKDNDKNSTVEQVGDDGELVVINPAKPGKEGRKLFKFNKVYGPTATQADVFSDIQPLVQSVLDGFNVCIFAYGQTGAGKTYTMMGPEGAKEEQWGVNYRTLSDLFRISKSRESTFTYEISVQMIEIYNENVRDLLSSGSSQKNLGILSNSQSSGLSVPDAVMFPVKATPDVLKLMEAGLKNSSKSATALNERSSRSHSVLTIHVRGTDLKTGSSIRSSLHLVDLAGSERVDRSEVTGDRLKEAQHINKSLSALGDVIFALAQKSSHIPYRNSKLTQVLQSSLGGQAKTLMFVQLNPDVKSYSETFSTLKFAERVSGVELGAAKSSKGWNGLMEQVSALKDTIAKKDDAIDKLQLQKQ